MIHYKDCKTCANEILKNRFISLYYLNNAFMLIRIECFQPKQY